MPKKGPTTSRLAMDGLDGSQYIPPPSSISFDPSTRPSSPSSQPYVSVLESWRIYDDLSPSATLIALVAHSSLFSDAHLDDQTLIKSVEATSDSQRCFAKKVAETSRLLRLWCDELGSWQWNGDFEVPSSGQGDEPEQQGVEEYVMQLTSEAAESTDGVHLGALPKLRVLKYEARLEKIRDDLDELDVEGQKKHVLESHLRNRHPALLSHRLTDNPETQAKLDDLTTLITTIVMQVLPYYSELTSLLNSWSARISVLRQVPRFLEELNGAQSAIDEAWLAIGVRQDRSSGLSRARTVKIGGRGLFRESFNKIRDDLENKVAKLGQRIDEMLDLLEGCEETLPDKWIDTVEGFEIDYSSWTVEAQKKVAQYEFRLEVRHDLANGVNSAAGKSPRLSETPNIPQQRKMMPGAWSDQEIDIACENRQYYGGHKSKLSIAFVGPSNPLLDNSLAFLSVLCPLFRASVRLAAFVHACMIVTQVNLVLL